MYNQEGGKRAGIKRRCEGSGSNLDGVRQAVQPMAWSGRRSIAYRFFAMYMSCSPYPSLVSHRQAQKKQLEWRQTHRHSRHLPQSSPELSIARRDDVTPVLCHSVHDAVVGVGTLVRARQPLEPRIPRDAETRDGGRRVSSLAIYGKRS